MITVSQKGRNALVGPSHCEPFSNSVGNLFGHWSQCLGWPFALRGRTLQVLDATGGCGGASGDEVKMGSRGLNRCQNRAQSLLVSC